MAKKVFPHRRPHRSTLNLPGNVHALHCPGWRAGKVIFSSVRDMRSAILQGDGIALIFLRKRRGKNIHELKL